MNNRNFEKENFEIINKLNQEKQNNFPYNRGDSLSESNINEKNISKGNLKPCLNQLK